MKVLLVASWYPDKNNGVSGVFIREQAVALSRTQCKVIVLYPYDKSLEKNELVSKVENGILTYRANTDYIKDTRLSRINSIIKTRKIIEGLINEHGIDVLHAHVCYSAGFAGAFYKKKHGIPFVITEHMSYISKYNRKFYNRMLFKFAYRSADLVIPVSTSLEREMKGFGFDFKSRVIGNVVNMDELPARSAKSSNEYNIVFIGMMSKNRVKGLEYLIPAFGSFIKNNRGVNIKLHIAGDGELMDEYKAMCTQYGVKDKIVFHGRLGRQELNNLILGCDFLISSSIKETFGSVLIEAMALGVPVLSTKCGGPQDFVSERVGMLVDVKSIDALERGILHMINNLGKYDPEYIKNYARENFSGESIGNKLCEIYADLIKK